MKLDRITLENFRQYYGRQRLIFSKDAKHNVTVIHGVNGAGKTSLFLAINWCLYGEGIANVSELMSKEAISQTDVGQTIKTSVELAFVHNGERYMVSRRLVAVKQKQGVVLSPGADEDFVIMCTRLDGQTERDLKPISTMNSVLPSNVRTYFLFDGEKIDQFAKLEASDEVRYAIYNVLKLEILTRGQKHLEDLATEYRRELKGISTGESRDLVEQEEKAHSDKVKALERKDELEREIDSARKKVNDIDQRLLEMQNTRALQQQRERIERDLQQRQTEVDELVGNVRDIATGGVVSIARPAIDRSLAILDEKRRRGEIPSNVRQQFIHDLIDRLECICGRPFELNGQEHQRLLTLMNSSLPGSLENEVLDTSAKLRQLAEQVESHKQSLGQAMRRLAALREKIKQLDDELSDVSHQLKGSHLEEVSQLESQRQGYQADVEDYRLQQGRLDIQITNLAEKIDLLVKQREKAAKAEGKERKLARKVHLAQQAAEAIAEIYQTFADDTRHRIETKTKDIFKLLVWKDSHFQDIRLGPDYNLEVIDRYGLPARPDLSAGERQVLSLSFITAMSRISEEEAPLVIDTPFGRLSSHHRNSITEHLPDLADQLVLFVTDEELRDQARRNLDPRIGAEYRLNFNRDTSCTTIDEEKHGRS